MIWRNAGIKTILLREGGVDSWAALAYRCKASPGFIEIFKSELRAVVEVVTNQC
jgi:hypothetical protein